MNFYLLSIIAFGVFVAILYLKSSEHQRMLYSQKYVRDKVAVHWDLISLKKKRMKCCSAKKSFWR